MADLFKKYNIDPGKYEAESNNQTPSNDSRSLGQHFYEELKKPRFDLGIGSDVLTGLETGHDEDVQGLMQLLTPGEESANSQEYARERNEKYGHAVERSPIATRAGYLGGKVGLPVLATAAAPLAAMAAPAALTARMAPYAAQYAKLGANNKFLTYLKGMLENSAKGGLWGGTSYVNPGETRGEHVGYGAAGGAAFKPVADVAKTIGYSLPKTFFKKSYDYLFPEKSISKELFGKMSPEELEKMLQKKKVAQKVGIQLTPAEASGNQLVQDVESSLGKTEKGNKALYAHGESRKKSEEEAVEKFIERVSPKKESAAKDVRQAARETIKESKHSLQEKASPFYEEAEKDTVSPNKFNSLMRDSNIEGAVEHVSKDKTYKSKLKNVSRNSIEYLNYVAKRMKDEVGAAKKSGEDHKASILTESRKKLLDKMDEASPNYKKARSIYAEEMPAIQELTEGNVGRLAELKGSQLKNASKIIFDPHETDLELLKQYRNTVGKQNPEAWRNIIRNEMERLISKSDKGSKGSDFYSQILKDDTKFNQFSEALGAFYGNKKTSEQKMLENFRETLKNLYQYKTTPHKGQEKIPIKASSWFDDKVHKLLGGNYDKKAIEMITDPNWEKYVKHAFPKEDPIKVMKDPGKVLQLLDKSKKLVNQFEKKHFEQALIRSYGSKNRGEKQ